MSSPVSLTAGLYLVATPIGNARDITLRALDILGAADVLAAEDTRSARRLMEIHGIALEGRPLLSYHEHSTARDREKLLAHLNAGKSVAYVSDAGTPLVADPGYQLVQAAIAAEVSVIPVPGASAALAGLTMAGLPTDRFFFAGFLPSAAKARCDALEELQHMPGTLVIYESPRRIEALLEDAARLLGDTRPAALARELTKLYEECRRGTLVELLEGIRAKPVKGECVLMIDRAASEQVSADDLDDLLTKALQQQRVKDAAKDVADITGLPRRQVYERALALSGKK